MYILWPEQLAYIEMDGVKRVKCWPLGSWTADLAPSTQIIERNALLPKDARERATTARATNSREKISL